MSKFSNYLKHLINDSGESISSLARNIGAERTSIHKALSDERILSYKTVQSLARHFNLSVDARKEFFQLYDILLQGEETYNNRQAVCCLLNNLASVDFSMAPPPEVSTLTISDHLIRGEFAVRSAIRSVLIYEISHAENAEFFALNPAQTLLQKIWNCCILSSHYVLPPAVNTNPTIFMRRQKQHRSLQWDTMLFRHII